MDIGQIREMCREVKDTTSRANNSLKQLVSEMRAMRRQEVELLVKLLAVNRSLQEMKRSNQISLIKHDDQGTGTQRPRMSTRSPEPKAQLGDWLSGHQVSTSHTADKKTNCSRSSESPADFKARGLNNILSEPMEMVTLPYEDFSWLRFSPKQTGLPQKESLDGIHWLPTGDNVQNFEKLYSTSPHDEDSGACTENEGDTLVVCRHSCSGGCCLKRDSGYVSNCSDVDMRNRTKSCSSISSTLSLSTLSSLSLTSELDSSHTSLPPSPPTLPSLGSLIF